VNHAAGKAAFGQQFELHADIVGKGLFAASHRDGRDEQVALIDQSGLERLAGQVGTIRGAGNPAGEIDRQYVDPSKIRELVGWEPRIDLEEGLRRTIDWYRAHPEARAPALKEAG
jgi:nucleoside-diphosphate-sugar epimerase